MTDETQLATLLSRELAHVVNRNALRAKREARTRADQMAWVGVGASVVEGGGNAKLLVQAAAVTTAVGFDHTIETIADQKGLEFLDQAGYGVGDTPAFYEMTLAYLAEVHSQGIWGWAPFSPPVQVTARIKGMKNLIATRYANQAQTRTPILDPVAFRKKVQPATIRQTELELASGLFVSAEKTARLATNANPRDSAAFLLLGKALSGQRMKPIKGRSIPAIQKVRDAFEESLRLAPGNTAAIRELAMTYYRTTGSSRSANDRREALRYFRRYLERAPRAGDRGYVEGYIAELEAEE